MHLSNWLVFCGVALLTTFTPGPAVLLAISNTVAKGPRRALICSLGNAFGLFLVSAIATAGMGVILAASATAVAPPGAEAPRESESSQTPGTPTERSRARRLAAPVSGS